MNRSSRLIAALLVLLAVASCTNIKKPDNLTASSSPPASIAIPMTASSSPTVSALPRVTDSPVKEPASSLQTPISSTPANGVGSIRPIHEMLKGRAAHTATLLPNGKVLIAGGFGEGNDGYTDTAELYDPDTGEFTFTGRMAFRRCCHTATLLPDGRLLIAGGFNGTYLSGAEIYDPENGTFAPTGDLTTPRMDHVAAQLDNGMVLLAGGVGEGWTFLATAELYDPATGLFTPTGAMSVPRESHTATKLQDGRVLITGGHQGRHADIVIYSSAEIYDPATGSFTQTGEMSVARHKHDAVLLRDGRVLISGGSDEGDDRNAYTSTELYDPSSGKFNLVADMPGIRYKHIGTSLLLPDGAVLLAGGAKNAVVYNPHSNLFSIVPGVMGTAPLSRLFSTATLLQKGSVLITGGYGLSQGVSAKAWLYSP